MNRRNLLKTLGLSAIGLATVPLWVDSWSADTLPSEGLDLTEKQRHLFTGLVNAMIPPTEIPGAIELQVDKFILVMLEDCFDPSTQKKFIAGLDEFENLTDETYSKSFLELSDQEQSLFLLRQETAEKTSEETSSGETASEGKFPLVQFTKRLTISGFMTSEYVMTNILNYELVPSRFHGTFPVDQSIYRNA